MMDRRPFFQVAFLSQTQKRAQARYIPVVYLNQIMPLPANVTGKPP